jgi:hypothetical protein
MYFYEDSVSRVGSGRPSTGARLESSLAGLCFYPFNLDYRFCSMHAH